MPPRIQPNTTIVGAQIRARRLELNLSIEEAAFKAQVGAKTWGRYEAGASIRQDKVRGVCHALGWKTLPNSLPQDEAESPGATALSDAFADDDIGIDESHEAWSAYLAEMFGRPAAIAFAYGSSIQLDQIDEDLTALSKLPRGTHLGQVDCSWTIDSLPEQFLTRYDYEFVYALRHAVQSLRAHFTNGFVQLHSVIEELALFLILKETDVLLDLWPESKQEFEDFDWTECFGDICGDTDLMGLLYTDYFVTTDNVYHFDHWLEQQFYMPEPHERESECHRTSYNDCGGATGTAECCIPKAPR